MYPPEMVQPMRDELVNAGVKELTTPDEVDAALKDAGAADTTLVFVNSVCGCAAGTARPGVIQSMKHEQLPGNVTTVFAGFHKDAVARARDYVLGFPPSSPSIALFRGGKLVDFIQRQDIEVRSAEQLVTRLTQSFDKFCGAEIDESVEITDPTADMEISATDVAELQKGGAEFKFLDVRTEHERALACIDGTELLTQELFDQIMRTWDKDTKIVLHCHSGMRSLEAARFLALKGNFTDVRSMSGGITSWSANVDASVPTY